jgi:segregation and condensation protein A
MAEPQTFVVELAQFSGPLDLLLTLLRDEQIDISDIPVARVAEQFVARIHTLGLDEAADFLEMAARLLRIKAQMLLPRRDGDENWEDPRAELVRRLLEYQQMREVVDVLERLGEARRNRLARPPDAGRATAAGLPATPPGPLAVSWIDLLGAVDRLLRAGRRPAFHAIVARALDVPGALAILRATLVERARVRWDDLVPAEAEPWQVLSVLFAVLELARLAECAIEQGAPFAPVEILRGRVPPRSALVADSEVALGDSTAHPEHFSGEPADGRFEPIGATV